MLFSGCSPLLKSTQVKSKVPVKGFSGVMYCLKIVQYINLSVTIESSKEILLLLRQFLLYLHQSA